MPGNPQLIVPVPPTLALGIDCDEIIVEQPAGIPHAYVIDAPPSADWTLVLRFRLGGRQTHSGGEIPGLEYKIIYDVSVKACQPVRKFSGRYGNCPT